MSRLAPVGWLGTPVFLFAPGRVVRRLRLSAGCGRALYSRLQPADHDGGETADDATGAPQGQSGL